MNLRDPKLTALLFNECINNQDPVSLSNLMTEDHMFIDRDGLIASPKEKMVKAWKSFFQEFPDYRNTFTRIESKDDFVILVGYAYWSEENPYDPVLWTAKIADDRVAEWRIHYDNEENRNLLGVT